MKKYKIEVEKMIRFMSDWFGFTLPAGHHIMNKVLTGCGFTEFFLRHNPKYRKVLLLSPRKTLLDNKEAQHNNPLDGIDIGEIYYARNEYDTVGDSTDIDLNAVNKSKGKVVKPKITPEDKIKESIESFKQKLTDYLARKTIKGEEIRIIVTYDSFRLVKEVLGDDIVNYQVVVDEFQSIFTDSRFKVDTEIELLHHLQDVPNVCYLSATPMIDEYLEMLPEFKDLPYYELDWEAQDPSRVRKPILDCKQVTSITSAATEEIQKYMKGDFERYSWRDEEGNIQEKFSTELVIYCNSVKNICDILSKNKLTPDQVNILCAKTEDNRKKINQTFKKIDSSIKTRGESFIGTVPQKGEVHKMFTFCTRTVYLGADFYSTCARSLILSDANIDSLAVDISLDLPQILGRQRLVENPWKDRAMFRFKTNTEKISEEEFELFIDDKIKTTESLLRSYDNSEDRDKKKLAEKYLKDATKYRDDYVAINRHAGSNPIPTFNNLVLVSEKRAFDIQQKDYADRFSVMNEIGEDIVDEETGLISEFLNKFNSLGRGEYKMKYLCEFLVARPEKIKEEILFNIPMTFKNYYIVLGPDKCKSWSYVIARLEREYQKQLSNQAVSIDQISQEVDLRFKEGEKYTKADLKSIMQGIYDSLGVKKTGKANDIENWFETKELRVTVGGKRVPGFELVKKK